MSCTRLHARSVDEDGLSSHANNLFCPRRVLAPPFYTGNPHDGRLSSASFHLGRQAEESCLRHDKNSLLHSRQPVLESWPEHREARGILRLSASANGGGGSIGVLCSILRGTLTLIIEGAGSGPDTVLAKLSVYKLIVSVLPGRFDMFRLICDTQGVCDDIYCFARDQTARNKWIAVFRRLGIGFEVMSITPKDSFRRKTGMSRSHSEPSELSTLGHRGDSADLPSRCGARRDDTTRAHNATLRPQQQAPARAGTTLRRNTSVPNLDCVSSPHLRRR
jgi:hypothetical protein